MQCQPQDVWGHQESRSVGWGAQGAPLRPCSLPPLLEGELVGTGTTQNEDLGGDSKVCICQREILG